MAAAHALGGRYNTPHGLANAVLLPVTLEAYGACIHKKLKRLAVAAKLCGEETGEEEAAVCFMQKIRAMNQAMGIPAVLPEIRRRIYRSLPATRIRKRIHCTPVPVLLDALQLERLFYAVKEE